jgi:hypothetical protein
VLAAELGAELGPGGPVPHHGGAGRDERVDRAHGGGGGGRTGHAHQPTGPVLGQIEGHKVLVAADDAEEVDLQLPERGGLLRILRNLPAHLLALTYRIGQCNYRIMGTVPVYKF